MPTGMKNRLRSSVAEIRWPALPAPGAALLLALQHQLAASEHWSPGRLAAMQLDQAGALLTHAAATSPFQRNRLHAAGWDPAAPLTPEVWARLPVLRRTEAAAAGAALHSEAPPASHGSLREVQTSGTSGIPLVVRKTQLEQLFWQALTLREELWHERDLAGRLCVIRAFPAATADWPAGAHHAGWGSPQADVFETGPAFALDMAVPVPWQADWLVRCEPDYLLSDADNLRVLAAHCVAAGVRLPRLRDVRAIGGVVDPALRLLCRQAWDVPVSDTYSCTEAGTLALQCPAHEVLHVQQEGVLLEVLDAAGLPCAPGQVGEVVVTPLHNFATPLIRYAPGDLAEPGPPCPCGRGLAVLRRVVGRVVGRTPGPASVTGPG